MWNDPNSRSSAALQGIGSACGRWFATLLCTLLVTSSASSQQHPTEVQVEAAYLYNFGKFVRWPENSIRVQNSPFTICVLGKDPFDGALESVIAGESIGGARLVVKNIASIEGASGCKVMYINKEELRKFKPALDNLRRLPIVTVSDAGGFLQQGGMIQFVLVNNRVRFEVNLDAAHTAGIEFSSELLKVANKVVTRSALAEERQR